MSTLLRRTLLPLAAFAAACSTTAHDPTQATLAPAPLGESRANPTTEPVWVESDWLIDRPLSIPGNRFRVRLVYRVPAHRAALAEQCVANHWAEACTIAQQALDTTNFQRECATAQDRQNWQAQMQERLTAALFPCVDGAPLATVTGLVVRFGEQTNPQ